MSQRNGQLADACKCVIIISITHRQVVTIISITHRKGVIIISITHRELCYLL